MACLISRRNLMAGAAGVSALSVPGLAVATALRRAPRMRVIVDNDLGGDPDGLFQLAQFALSPSVAIPLLIGTHYKDFGPAGLIPDKAALSARRGREVLKLVPGRANVRVLAGSEQPLQAPAQAAATEASNAIVAEALRTDTQLPLFYAAGGSLTEVARAWLTQPKIGPRLRLLWIGGAEHAGLGEPPPGPDEAEYNFSLDRLAAQIVFNQSDIEIWQVPRNAFRQLLIGLAELEPLAQGGPLGRYLWQQVAESHDRLEGHLPPFIYNPGEVVTLGDTALVTLSALQSAFQPDSASSPYVVRPTPLLQDDGSYRPNPQGRPMRIYTGIDTRLTFQDMLAKLREAGRRR